MPFGRSRGICDVMLLRTCWLNDAARQWVKHRHPKWAKDPVQVSAPAKHYRLPQVRIRGSKVRIYRYPPIRRWKWELWRLRRLKTTRGHVVLIQLSARPPRGQYGLRVRAVYRVPMAVAMQHKYALIYESDCPRQTPFILRYVV